MGPSARGVPWAPQGQAGCCDPAHGADPGDAETTQSEGALVLGAAHDPTDVPEVTVSPGPWEGRPSGPGHAVDSAPESVRAALHLPVCARILWTVGAPGGHLEGPLTEIRCLLLGDERGGPRAQCPPGGRARADGPGAVAALLRECLHLLYRLPQAPGWDGARTGARTRSAELRFAPAPLSSPGR